MLPALHPGFSNLLRSPPALRSTPTNFGCLLFLIVQASSFLIHPLFQHSQLGYLWLPTPHCAAPVWLKGYHTMAAVTRCFPPNPYLGEKRMLLEVASILRMCLSLHTELDYNQLLVILDWNVKTNDALLLVKNLIKKNSCHINQQSSISSHFSQLPKVNIKICSLKKKDWRR